MKDLAGKTAFVTGGASGIGFAMAEAFLREGMNVMLADIEEEALAAAAEKLGGGNAPVRSLVCDVAVREAVNEAAQETISQFGNVHIVCNNAGIGGGGAFGTIDPGDWDWTLAVNISGVVYGIETFLPHMQEHGEGGHFVNTASMAGMLSIPGMGPYNASKFAVVSMSETLDAELAETNVGVSVLCPGFVRTHIYESGKHRQAQFGGAKADATGGNQERAAEVADMVRSGLDPALVANRVIECIRDEELYIFTHPDFLPLVRDRFARIERAFESAEASPALKGQA